MRKSYTKYLSFFFLLFSIAAFSFSAHTFTLSNVEVVKQDKKQFENNCFYSSSSSATASKSLLQQNNLAIIYSFDKGRDLPFADLNNQFSTIYSVRTNSSFTGKIIGSTGNHLGFIYPSHNFW